MNVCIILSRRSGPYSIIPEVARLLTEWGTSVEVMYPEERVIELTPCRVDHDLYLLKSKSKASLALAGALEAAGASILNPYRVTALLRDKIITARVLSQAGVPVPPSWVARTPLGMAPRLRDGPLVFKPYRGSRGIGVRIIKDEEALAELDGGGYPLFFQRFLPPDGLDRKIYSIGDQLFGVERVWPAGTYVEKVGRPFTISAVEREIALRCRRVLGSALFGVDVVMSGGTPYVVDASSFPGFLGVPDAALRLADYAYSIAHRVTTGETCAARTGCRMTP